MKRMKEMDFCTFDTIIPKAKFWSTNYHNTVALEKQQLPLRPSSRVHCKNSCHILSVATSSRQSLKMQTEYKLLLPFTHQQSFLLICEIRFHEPNLFVLYTSASIKITGTIMTIRPTHKNLILQNHASNTKFTVSSSYLQACFKTQHWFNTKVLLILEKKKYEWETQHLKSSSFIHDSRGQHHEMQSVSHSHWGYRSASLMLSSTNHVAI